MQETSEIWVRFLGWEDPLEEGTATHSSLLAWRIPWTEEPGGLQSTGSQRVVQDWSNWAHVFYFRIDFRWLQETMKTNFQRQFAQSHTYQIIPALNLVHIELYGISFKKKKGTFLADVKPVNKKFLCDVSPNKWWRTCTVTQVSNYKHSVGDGAFHIYIKMYISSMWSLHSTVNFSQLLNTCKES